METEGFQEKLQQHWDNSCRAKGYHPRQGMETRYTEAGDCYNPLPGFGRVQFEARFGWIAVLSFWGGWKREIYQYVKLDTALVADPMAKVDVDATAQS